MHIHASTGVGLGRVPVRIAGLYSAFGLLWIWLSDWSLVWLGYGDDHAFLAGAIKGTAFVVVTATLLFWLVRREVAAARRSEGLLRAVVEGTTDAVFVKDRDGRYMLANEAAARFIGRPAAEVLGRNDRELFGATDAERLVANDRAVMADGNVVTFEETLTSSGAIRTYLATKAPYRDATGGVVGLFGVSRDITERKAIEDALRISERRIRELADAIPQMVWTAGPDGAITHLNAKTTEYTGLEEGDLVGWSWQRAIHPDDKAYAVAMWTRILGEGVPQSFQMRIQRADGEYRWHIIRQHPIRDDSGVIASWVGTNTDIDDLRRTEDALRETDTRLREAQRIAQLGSWSWEPPANRVWWSEAEFELFGVDPLNVLPTFEAFLGLLHSEDRSIAVARVEAMLAGAEEFADDLRIVRPDGSMIWIHSRARAYRDAEGRLVRVEGTDHDVTARRIAEVAARESESRLQAAVEVAGLGIIVVDYERQAADLSPEAAEQFGFPPGTSVTRAELHARFHPDDKSELERLIKDASSSGGTGGFDLEHRVVWPDGSTRWLNVRKQISFVDGHPHRAVVVTLDVTDRRLADEALRTSEARYRLMFEANPHPMWVYDVDSLKFLAVNDAAVASYGYSREEFLSMNIRDIRPPEEVPRLESTIARLTPGISRTFPWRHLRKDGTSLDVEAIQLQPAGWRRTLSTGTGAGCHRAFAG